MKLSKKNFNKYQYFSRFEVMLFKHMLCHPASDLVDGYFQIIVMS